MKIKNVEMRTFFEIETEEGERYRKDSFKYWEKYDGSESWCQLYPSDELVEMERLFQEYCKPQNFVNRGKPKFVLEDDIDE